MSLGHLVVVAFITFLVFATRTHRSIQTFFSVRRGLSTVPSQPAPKVCQVWVPHLISLSLCPLTCPNLLYIEYFFTRLLRTGTAPQGVPLQIATWLLGPVLQLYCTCPWELMKTWVQSAPVVKVRILFRQAIIVGCPEGLKRIFQTKQRLYDKDLGWTYYPFLPILGEVHAPFVISNPYVCVHILCLCSVFDVLCQLSLYFVEGV
jgi:hypothetical protein